MRLLSRSYLILGFLSFFSWFSYAQENQLSAPQTPEKVSIPFLKADITFDGELDEAVWSKARKISLNIVNYPYENTPSPVNTEAYVFEDGEKLYFAFIADDPEPEKIQGFLRDRDDAFADDIVGIKLDTFNDHRLAYKFFVNPFGVQNDGISNEMTGDDTSLWDAIWSANGKITDKGYQVEFAIPYSELNFEEGTDIKTWGIELVRIYPRDNILRISNIPLDRDNICWVCQMAEIEGFEQAKSGNSLLVTPSVVASRNESRDVYSGEDWNDDNETDLGLNVRWGITQDIMFNATINPDFSTIESDAGQLSVNKNYALFYNEKRPFFLDNSEYFSSPYSLVYTRNIADPDFGTKVTGRLDNHSFGFFMTKDQYTNIILPGNDFSLVDTINDESYSSALRYRYDVNHDLSFGFISTLRTADDYHNLVSGFDTKYRLDVSNTLIAQVLTSDTEYPQELLSKWCDDDSCALTSLVGKDDDSFSDQAYKIGFEHNSEEWYFDANIEEVGADFRADLGYVTKVDVKNISSTLRRTYYSDDQWWTTFKLGGSYLVTDNTDDELISETYKLFSAFEGPWQSYIELTYLHIDSVGLRDDPNDHSIDGNTTLFEQDSVEFYLGLQPQANLNVSMFFNYGKSIDYNNNRLGDVIEFAPNVVWNITNHLEMNLAYTFARLEHDNDYVFKENITDTRLTYQFDVNSYLRLTMVYTTTDYNLDNNPLLNLDSKQNNNLATQLIYSYKLNPQTVFFLGYSDSSIEDDHITSLKQTQRTAFLKLSYAMM